MTDKELLEAAARAAGIEVVRSRLSDPINKDMLVIASSRNPFQATGPWNPLTDDGDALRLAVKLKIPLRFPDWANIARTWGAKEDPDFYEEHADDHNGDLAAASRRAIVRAAASIGQAQEGKSNG